MCGRVGKRISVFRDLLPARLFTLIYDDDL